MPDSLIKNYINGEWVASGSQQTGDIWNPATGAKIATVPYSNQNDVDMAVAAAREAYPEWRATPPLTRARYLFRLKEAFEEQFEDIARTLTTEHGKAIDEARGEVRRMIENVEHATGVTTLMCGYTLEDIAKGIDCYGHRQPMGVFAAIAPYNFPVMVPWWFLPYALVAGNTFVLKPSEQVPMTQTKVFDIIDEIGFPEGVVNMVHGSRDVVNALLDHSDIEGISFVGSTPTAKYIYKRCGETGKRVQALGGAKNIVAIMPDADLKAAMPSLVTSFFGCTGQRCLSGSILVPVGDVADRLRDEFMAAAREMKVGDGLDEQTFMGPLISAAHRERVLGYIEKGIAEGAELVLDGRDYTDPERPGGFFVGPTVFDRVTPDMTIAREEIFGPVLAVLTCEDEADAVRLANDTNYGLHASIWSDDLSQVMRMSRAVRAGTISVNCFSEGDFTTPFGGFKESGFFGRDKSLHACRQYTELKTVWMAVRPERS